MSCNSFGEKKRVDAEGIVNIRECLEAMIPE
jgi:hypothetical protein